MTCVATGHADRPRQRPVWNELPQVTVRDSLRPKPNQVFARNIRNGSGERNRLPYLFNSENSGASNAEGRCGEYGIWPPEVQPPAQIPAGLGCRAHRRRSGFGHRKARPPRPRPGVGAAPWNGRTARRASRPPMKWRRSSAVPGAAPRVRPAPARNFREPQFAWRPPRTVTRMQGANLKLH